MHKSQAVSAVADFLVLPLHVPAQPSFSREAIHYLYLRPNAPRVPTEDTPREVFLVNVPIDATATNLRTLFAEQLGGSRVEKVDFEGVRVAKGIKATAPASDAKKGKKRKRESDDAAYGLGGQEIGLLPEVWDRPLLHSGATAVVRFVDRASAELTLREARRAVKSGRKITWSADADTHGAASVGSARYLRHHRLRYPDAAVLQDSVDTFMAAFSAQEAERARSLAKQRAVPDEDGFVTVTRGGRVGPAREEEARAKEEELRRRDKDRIKDDFYRFQVREKRKEQAKDLVRDFEVDRRRVEELVRRRGRIRPE